MTQLISAIYAVSENEVIGIDGDLPWHLPGDLQFFKQTTLDKPIIMGRKTYQSIGRALPRRRNLVLTRQADFEAPGIEVFPNLEQAIAACSNHPEVVIIGGAALYKEAFAKGLVGRVYQTLVHAEVDGDTFFSLPDPDHWKIDWVEAQQADEKNEYAYTFRRLERADPG
ncbi:MAG: dihydrofolate reductase [Bacteroidota bacterium]